MTAVDQDGNRIVQCTVRLLMAVLLLHGPTDACRLQGSYFNACAAQKIMNQHQTHSNVIVSSVLVQSLM